MDIFGTVTSAVSIVELLYRTSKDLRDRLENVSQNPRLVRELIDSLERLSSRLEPIVTTCRNNHVQFSAGYLQTFEGCIKRLQGLFKDAQSELEDMREKLNSRTFGFRKAKTTSKRLSQLLASIEKAEQELVTISAGFASAETIVKIGRSGPEKDTYHPSFDIESNPSHVVLDYGSESDMLLDKEAISHLTVEAQLKHTLLRSNGSQSIAAVGASTGKSVGIAGMGGVGKSCALRGLACDEQVRQRFPDGVFLLVLGKDVEEPDIVQQIGLMLKKSGGHETRKVVSAAISLRVAAGEAKEWFSSKCILLLIDDIWESCNAGPNVAIQLEQIVDRGCNSRVALTTRELRVASRGDVIQFAVRNETTASEMLLKAAGVEHDVDEMLEPVVGEVLKFCGGLPMALSVVGRAIKLRHSVGKGSMQDAWNEQLKLLQKHRVRVLGEGDPSYTYANLSKAFGASLAMLDESSAGKPGVNLPLSFEAMYRSLIVLRRQNAVPANVLGGLWVIGGVEATEVIQTFVEMSLAERNDVRVKGVRRAGIILHDLQLDFVQNACEELCEEHEWPRKLLRSLVAEEECILKECGKKCRKWWSDEIFEDEYVRNNVCRLLRNAGLKDELVGVLGSAEWTGKRLRYAEILELEDDFRMELGSVETTNEELRERGGLAWSLKMIIGAARLCVPYVSRNPREVWFQLYGRLVGHGKVSDVLKKFLEEIEEVAERPWAKPVSACLPEPGRSFFQTMICSARVKWISVSNEEERIIACATQDDRQVQLSTFQHGVLEKEVWLKMRTEGTVNEGDRRDQVRCRVRSVSCTKSGERVVTGHDDGTLQVWEVESGEAVGEPFRGHSSWVTCVAWSGDGKWVASVSYDATVRVWEAESGEPVGEAFRGHSSWVTCVAWSEDGKRLASGSYDATVRVWEVESGEAVGEPLRGHSGSVLCVAWSEDGKRVASGSYDGTVRVWELKGGEPVGEPIRSHSDPVTCVAWSKDGKRVASGSYDETVRVWEVESGEAMGEPFRGHCGAVSCVAWSEDGKWVASLSYDATVRVWDVKSAACLKVCEEEWRNDECLLTFACRALADKGGAEARQSLVSDSFPKVDLLHGTQLCSAQRYGDDQERAVLATFEEVAELHWSAASPRFVVRLRHRFCFMDVVE